ncbi:MAG: methionine adenosyltransferase [Candidatus Micrarchaeia archaeon]
MKNIAVHALDSIPIEKRDIEFVERKGVGHPDSLIDGIVESVSRELGKEYLSNAGAVLHHNVDKGLIIGGASEARFGYGRITKPIEVIITGRATEYFEGKNFDVNGIARRTAEKYLKEHTRFLDIESEVKIESKIAKGSADLQHIFMRGNGIALANDTSFGAGFAPLSDTERLVLEAENYLNSREYKSRMPMAGEDIKVMGAREKDSINLTIAIAFVAPLVKDLDDYVSAKERIRKDVLSFSKKITEKKVDVEINTGDSIEKQVVYLTKSGLSCEAGDDGSVGRGNRVNGLITPFRSMSLEAAAGKNPISHVGKIYNIFAMLLSEAIVKEYPDIDECDVALLSQIGRRIDDPKSLSIGIVADDNIYKSVNSKVAYMAEQWLEGIGKITEKIYEGKYPTF